MEAILAFFDRFQIHFLGTGHLNKEESHELERIRGTSTEGSG